MNEDRNKLVTDRLIRDLVDEVINEEFGVLIESAVTEYTKSLKTFIRSRIRERRVSTTLRHSEVEFSEY